MGSWRLLDHTADLAIEATGSSAEDALVAMCGALVEQMLGPTRDAGVESVAVEVHGLDLPETVVSVLGEIIYLVASEGWAFEAFEVRQLNPHRASLIARGWQRDPDRHAQQDEIKAATYHDFRFRLGDDGQWRLRVVFDV